VEERKSTKYRVSELTYELIENSIKVVVDMHAKSLVELATDTEPAPALVIVEEIHWDKDFRANREDFIYVLQGGEERNGSVMFELGEQGFDVNIYLHE